MSDLALAVEADDENPDVGDLLLVDGQIVLVTGIDAIRQDVLVRLRTFRGEWFLDRRIGVPWFQKILGHKVGLPAVERVLRAAILATPGVEAITELALDFDPATRSLSLDFEARTIEGGEPIAFTDFVLPLEPEESTT